MLAPFSDFISNIFSKNRLLLTQAMLLKEGRGSRPPVPFYRPSGLPFFQAELPGIFFKRWYRAVLNSGPTIESLRRKTLKSYLALAGL